MANIMTVGGGETGPYISILPMEHPHVNVRKRYERHVPAPVAVDMLFNTYSSRMYVRMAYAQLKL